MMTIQDLKSKAPSVFTTEKSPKLSDRYMMVPTIDVVNKFMDAGWEISKANQVGSGPFNRHSVRMRNSVLPKVGDSLVEAIITNSHNGTSKLEIGAGLFRLVCSNGLVISQQELISLNQRHMKISMDEVEMITETFIKSTPVIERSVNRMSEIKMDTDKQVDFATKAMGIRWKNTEDISTMTIDSILNP
ncbi:DUF932 domain-containing protein, partial [bacterium]|nr:DUF932 domain-containing protein [bacterium]